MKIYNKIYFALGINFILIAAVIIVMSIIQNEINLILAIGFIPLIVGSILIYRSMNKVLTKKDYTKISDERNIEIRNKAKEKSLVVLESILSFLFFGIIIYYANTKYEWVITYGIICISIIATLELLQLIFVYYYSKKI